MNIVYHHRTRGIGAEGVHIREIYQAFIRQGHHIKMVSLTNKNVVEKEVMGEKKNRYSKGILFLIRAARKKLAILYNLPGTMYLFMRTDRKTDFIYERYSLYNLAGIIVSRIRKIPLILEVNAPYAFEVEEHEMPLFPRLAQYTEKWIFHQSTMIIVVSHSLKQYLVDLGIAEKKIVVQTNGVDLTVFDYTIQGDAVRQQYGLQHKKVVGFIGGLAAHHGLLLLLEALKTSNLEVSLMLVGSGSLEQELKKKAKEYNIDAIFPGRIPHERIPAYIAAMDICIKPDANPYCSPLKIFEYMAMKKPIIAVDTPSIREILHKDTALLIHPVEDEIRQAITYLFSHPKRAKELSDQAYQDVLLHFSWDKNAQEVIRRIAVQAKIAGVRSFGQHKKDDKGAG